MNNYYLEELREHISSSNFETNVIGIIFDLKNHVEYLKNHVEYLEGVVEQSRDRISELESKNIWR